MDIFLCIDAPILHSQSIACLLTRLTGSRFALRSVTLRRGRHSALIEPRRGGIGLKSPPPLSKVTGQFSVIYNDMLGAQGVLSYLAPTEELLTGHRRALESSTTPSAARVRPPPIGRSPAPASRPPRPRRPHHRRPPPPRDGRRTPARRLGAGLRSTLGKVIAVPQKTAPSKLSSSRSATWWSSRPPPHTLWQTL